MAKKLHILQESCPVHLCTEQQKSKSDKVYCKQVKEGLLWKFISKDDLIDSEYGDTSESYYA